MNWMQTIANKFLKEENELLKKRIYMLESQYGDPYMNGFTHGIEMAYKFAVKIEDHIITQVKTQAIQETLERMNDKKKH